MHTTWTQVILVLLPVVVGAVIGVVPTIFLERTRIRAALRTRWDPTLQESCAGFAATARRLLELSGEIQPGSEGADRGAAVAAMRAEHARLQTLMAEVRLLAGVPVQLAAREVVRHGWALRVMASVGADPRAADFGGREPRERVLEALFDFYRVARRELQVRDADGLAPLNPPLIGALPSGGRSS
jgi:hypothetical protein